MEYPSPWVLDLNQTPRARTTYSDRVTDIAIIGGGVAGIATAYLVLQNTPYHVILVDPHRTEHTVASALLPRFEQPFPNLLDHFERKHVSRGQGLLEQAWHLLKRIFRDTNIKPEKTMSHADFVHQLRAYITTTFPERYEGIEEVPIHHTTMAKDHVRLHTKYNMITAGTAIACMYAPDYFHNHTDTPLAIHADCKHLIGPDPKNSRLLYNLHPHDDEFLPAVHGGYELTKHLNGEPVEPSIFI